MLHKFLRQNRLEGSRILVVQSGMIEVQASENEKRKPVRPAEAAKPSALETIPTCGILLLRESSAQANEAGDRESGW
jgi:hypothetical protein